MAAACGGDSSSSPAKDELRTAVERTEATGSYRFEVLIEPDDGLGVVEAGEIDIVNGLGSSLVTSGGVSTPRFSDRGADYVLSESPSGKLWVRYDHSLDSVSRSVGAIAAALVGGVERGEPQLVDGVTLVAYIATLPGGDGPAADVIRTGPITFWVAPDGLVARLTYEVFQSNGDGSSITTQVTLRYWDFGAVFEITLPLAEDVLSPEQFEEIFSAAAAGAKISSPAVGR